MEYTNCPVCDSDSYTIYIENTTGSNDGAQADSNDDFKCTSYRFSSFYRLVECKTCGLIYNNPRDSMENLNQAYVDVQDPEYLNQEEARIATYNKLLDTAVALKPAGNLLDIGCYTGVFLGEAQKRGYSVFGVEPSSWASQVAINKKNLTVENCGILDYKNPQKFDMITMWDVVEHLPEIRKVFMKNNALLNTGGIVGFSTHNIKSITAKILGKRYPFIMRMHVCHFSPRTLQYFLKQTGFEMIKIETHQRYLKLDYFMKRLHSYNKFLYYTLKPLSSIFPKDKLIQINFLGLINCFLKLLMNWF